MPTRSPALDRLLAVQSHRTIAEGDLPIPEDLSLPDALALTAHLRSLASPGAPLRIAVIHTYTSDLLNPWLDLEAAVQGLTLDIYNAPYGLSPFEAQPGSGLARHAPDLTLFLLRREDLHPGLAQPLVALQSLGEQPLADEILSRLSSTITGIRNLTDGRILLSLLPPLSPPALGLFDAQAMLSEGAWWASLKARIAAFLRERIARAGLLDLDDLLAELGRRHTFDLRIWYSARFPFTARAARELARRVVAIAAIEMPPVAKVVAVDADNTMWGGIIGEEGLNGISLGPEYPGSPFLDFQRRLLDFQQRGFLLALCSKNNPEDVAEVLDQHPHQLLRNEHFAARRVNWQSKTDNLASIAEELNLGLESFVFVDDSDQECAMVRRLLPQVTVVQTPSRPVAIPGCLDRLVRLEILSLTAEDSQKTRMYAEERQRRELQDRLGAGAADPADYFASLQMRMSIALDDSSQLARLTQLTQKTNQFNLTSRRYTEEQIQAFVTSPGWLVASFSLADIFGDSGTVGLALVQLPGDGLADIDSFLMSCRVIGRTAETAFLETLLQVLGERGIERVAAHYLPTPKNRLVQDFWPNHRFSAAVDRTYIRNLSEQPTESADALVIEVTLADAAH